ncbi:MAG: recombinase family protein [Firmicutes bacterium]|nr:recombinase family protein [Bacillota bacterium]MDY4486645.1 recombinase family protein [Candidatus Limivicinus sp.]MDY6160029.1 recombinase family protein [Candidatus Faecousia sp.]
MTYIYHNGGEDAPGAANGFEKLLEELQSGDCMVVERLECAAKDSAGLLALLERLEERGIRFRSVEEKLDTGTEEGRFALEILKKAAQLDAKGKHAEACGKEDGKAKGRKPIEVDEEMFDSILERWKNGEITARQAMAELNLKPNTFYRRVKERMPDAKSAESLLDAAKKFGKDIVNTVAEGSEEFQQAAGKFAAEHDMGNISETVKKNITAAGMVFSRHMDSLSKDFQDAMEKFEKKQQEAAKPAEPAEVAEEQKADAAEETPVVDAAPEEEPEAPEVSEAPEAAPTEEASSQPGETEYL